VGKKCAKKNDDVRLTTILDVAFIMPNIKIKNNYLLLNELVFIRVISAGIGEKKKDKGVRPGGS
jgi:hypothetical protein